MESALEKRVMSKVSWRIIPFIMILYFVAFLDRVNIGFAAIHMNEDIGLDPAIFGLGAGLFFIGYFLFEVPSNLALEKFGARLWIAGSRPMSSFMWIAAKPMLTRSRNATKYRIMMKGMMRHETLLMARFSSALSIDFPPGCAGVLICLAEGDTRAIRAFPMPAELYNQAI